MKRYGITPVFWKTFGSRIERSVMGAVAQDGMEQAKERMRDGIRRKARRRQRITAKLPVLGYKLVDKYGNEKTMEARKDTHYAIDENRKPLIDFIFDALAYHDMTTYALVNALDALADTDPRYLPNRAKGWHEGRIVQLVRNTVYKGEFVANRSYEEHVAEYDEKTGTYYKAKRRRQRPEHEWVRIPVPASVDCETWQRANDALEKNKHRTPHNRYIDYLLVSLVRCAVCGYRYRGETLFKGGSKEAKYPSRYRCSKTTHLA
jgi:site-specific DNA recombinase